MRNDFYIYCHINLETGQPFYIGKGVGKRSSEKWGRSKWWNNIVNKYGYDILHLDEDLTEEEAYKLEVEYITKLGRRDLGTGILVNMSAGGIGGLKGRVFSEETKLKMSKAQKGRKAPKGTIERLAKVNSKAVIDTVTGQVWNSIKELCDDRNLKPTTISSNLSPNNNRRNNTVYEFYNISCSTPLK